MAIAAEQSTPGIDNEYKIEFVAAEGPITAKIGGTVVAETENAIFAHETHLPTMLYIPRADIKPGILRRDDRRTFCPFKGTAIHWSVNLAGQTQANAAWCYERPLSASRQVAGYVAFYAGIVDEWIAGERDKRLLKRAGNRLATNPLLTDWIMRQAWLASSPGELTAQLGETCALAGIPLMRLHVGIWTLHPQLVGTSYTWVKGQSEVEVVHTPRGMLQEESYLKSPERFVSEGLGGVRQRLDDDDPEFLFPIMEYLRDAGGTDYVAMPLWFSDGQIHTLAITSGQQGGFSVAELGQIFDLIPVLSRLYEVHTLRSNTKVLLDTYLGSRTGERVLNGLTQRGDGEQIEAVIWFCDLRDSTTLADTLPHEIFLGDLNQFFDDVAGAVLDYGGEVLQFIGDAVLAIFPIPDAVANDQTGNLSKVCYIAVEAVEEARRRVAQSNKKRQAEDRPPLQYGIGLHIGQVTYGNIGTHERLEFTVIGAAANEAARVESLCKELGIPILFSAAFAAAYPENLTSVGTHQLKGVKGDQEIFTLQG